MKNYIASGDWHIWLKREVPIAWQIDRYHQLFDTLISLCKEHNAELIVTGDCFEKSEPDYEELQLFLEFFRRLKEEKIVTYLISGNHCTFSRGKDLFQLLDIGRDKTIDVHYKDHGWYLEVPEEKTTFWLLNHCNLSDTQWETPAVHQEGLNILISHFRCNLGFHIKEEIDVAGLLQSFDLAVCSDVHMPYEDGKLIYTNAPINKVFEKEPNTGALLLTLDNGTFKTTRIKTDLPALIQRSCSAEDFATLDINERDYFRVEVTGSLPELRLLTAAPNMRLIKQPLVDVVLTEFEEEIAAEVKETTLETGLIVYMDSLKFSEEKVGRMLDVWREV